MQNVIKITLKTVAVLAVLTLIGLVSYQGTVYQIEHPELVPYYEF